MEQRGARLGRVLVVAAAVVASVVGLGGCSSSDGGSAGGLPTTDPAAAAELEAALARDAGCEAAAAFLYSSPEQELADGAAGAPASGLTGEQRRAFLLDLVPLAAGDAEATADVEAMVEAEERFAGDPDGFGEEERAAATAAGDRLIAWAAGECPPARPVWACLVRSTFEAVGGPVDPGPAGGDDPGAGGPAAATARAALGIPAGEEPPTALVEQADLALFARVDEAGLVQKAWVVERSAGGWAVARSPECRAT